MLVSEEIKWDEMMVSVGRSGEMFVSEERRGVRRDVGDSVVGVICYEVLKL